MKKLKWGYIIQEILIVIIGISIAFALNNWQANQADAKLQQQYLDNLVFDIQQELEQLEINKQEMQAKLGLIRQVRPLLNNANTRKDTVARKIFEIAKSVSFHPVNATYQTLINSGDMKLIDDFELRRSIEEHYSLHKIILRNYDRLDNIYKEYLGRFFIYDIDFGAMRQGNFDFLENPLLSNIINSIEGSYYIALQGNERCRASNQALLEKMETK